MKTRSTRARSRSIYDNRAVMRRLVATLKAAEALDVTVCITHKQSVPGRLVVVAPEADDFTHIDAVPSMLELYAEKVVLRIE